MRNAIRWLPALIGTNVLSFYVGSPVFAQATTTARWCIAAVVVIAVMIATAFACAITRSSKQQQSSGFGYAARTRTGRN